MKILFIADGKSDHTQVIANYFAQKKHEVHLISYQFIKGYDQHIHFHQMKRLIPHGGNLANYLDFLLCIFQVKRLVTKIKPDILNAHYITTYGLLAALTGFHPLVVTAWGSDVLIQPQRSLFWRWCAKYVLREANLFTCLFDVDILGEEMGKLVPYGLKTASLPHGIDTSLFNKNNKRNDLRRIHGLEANDPIIINIRGLVPIFDPITFIRAIPYVVKKFTSVKFLVTYQKEHKETYEKLIQRLNVDKNVIILDWMPNEKVAEYLAIADIYVSTSLSDGASNALFEGMSCELAPVVTDIPANRCWIKDGENGFLFKSGDYLALAEKINCLLGDKDKRKLFGKKCREIVCEKADYEIQMAKTEKVYQVLVNEYSKK